MNDHERISALIESEPDPAGWDEATRRHVRECGVCARTAEASAVLRERLRRLDVARARAPESLRARLRASMGDESPATPAPRAASTGSGSMPDRAGRTRPVSPRRWRGRPAGWMVVTAMAASLVLGIGLGRWGRPGGGPPGIDRYLADVTHDRYLLERTGRPLEFEVDRSNEASRWLSKSLGIDVQIPDAPSGWALEGVRVWHTLSRLSAMAVYQDVSHREIVVFAVPVEDLVFEGSDARSLDGRTYFLGRGWGNQGVAWRQGNLAWAAVADLPVDDLLSWAARLKARP